MYDPKVIVAKHLMFSVNKKSGFSVEEKPLNIIRYEFNLKFTVLWCSWERNNVTNI